MTSEALEKVKNYSYIVMILWGLAILTFFGYHHIVIQEKNGWVFALICVVITNVIHYAINAMSKKKILPATTIRDIKFLPKN